MQSLSEWLVRHHKRFSLDQFILVFHVTMLPPITVPHSSLTYNSQFLYSLWREHVRVCFKQGHKIEGVVILRVGMLGFVCPQRHSYTQTWVTLTPPPSPPLAPGLIGPISMGHFTRYRLSFDFSFLFKRSVNSLIGTGKGTRIYLSDIHRLFVKLAISLARAISCFIRINLLETVTVCLRFKYYFCRTLLPFTAITCAGHNNGTLLLTWL